MKYFNPPQITESKAYYRYIKMSLDEIPTINKVGRIIQFDNGLYVNASSTRVKLFLEQKDFACHCCGITTSFAAVESCLADQTTHKSKTTPHLNFYGLDVDGKEVLMTWDHIKPRSLGGKDNIDNAQCLCCYCNTFKGNSYSFEDVRKKRKEKGMPLYF